MPFLALPAVEHWKSCALAPGFRVSEPNLIRSPKALDLQSRILKRVPLEQPEMIPFQNQVAASICVQIGEHHLTDKDYDSAMKSYKDALAYSPTDNKVWSNTLGPGECGSVDKVFA